jgi:hypothetical protein
MKALRLEVEAMLAYLVGRGSPMETSGLEKESF